ncbi:MAG: methionyl-tRNA formyltransferase [bacterium JZ-2024 1]
MNCFFAGSDFFSQTIAQTLLEEKVHIVACLAPPDVPRGRNLKVQSLPFVRWLRQNDIPVFQPVSLKDSAFLSEFFASSQKYPDAFFLLASYGKIIPKILLDVFPERTFNVHPSLLPRYRGAAPVIRAIMAGETSTGVSIIMMTPRMDAGDILLQSEPISIEQDDTALDVWGKLLPVARRLVSQLVQYLRSGIPLPRRAQEEKEATYAPKLRPEEERIDFTRTAREVHNLIRSLNPSPGAYTFFRGQVMKVWKTRLTLFPSPFPPGTIWKEGNRVYLSAADGVLEILQVQIAGRRRLNALDWAVGVKPPLIRESLNNPPG